MKVLLIDDDSLIEQAFRSGLGDTLIELVVANTRDDALAQPFSEFDLIVCDLKMPPSTGGTPEIEHGLAVCDQARTLAPGVPVMILSGFGTLNHLENRLAEAPQERFLGAELRPLLRHVSKDRLDEAVGAVRAHLEALERLQDEIEIAWGAESHPLTNSQRQVLRLYARQRKGVVVRLRRFSGGRSSATTLWLEIEDAQGAITGRGVVKLDDLASVESEASNVRDHVAPLLPAGSYAGSFHVVRAGAGGCGGLFYSLAAGYDKTLFDLLRADPEAAAAVVERVCSRTEPWHGHPTRATSPLREIRRGLLTDPGLADIRDRFGDFVDFSVENRSVSYNRTTTHGDMHGGNILVAADKAALLIDFGRVGFAPCALDPITLEASAVLHPDADLALGGWPTLDQARVWPSADYLEDSPIRPFLEACRRWVDAAVRGDRERDATLYSYATRQLQYSGIDADHAMAFAQGAVSRILGA